MQCRGSLVLSVQTPASHLAEDTSTASSQSRTLEVHTFVCASPCSLEAPREHLGQALLFASGSPATLSVQLRRPTTAPAITWRSSSPLARCCKALVMLGHGPTLLPMTSSSLVTSATPRFPSKVPLRSESQDFNISFWGDPIEPTVSLTHKQYLHTGKKHNPPTGQ